VGLVYLPFEFLKFRAHYAEAFAMPTASQLDSYFDYGGYGFYVGNPNLIPETSDTYEVGVDVSNTHANASLTYFWIKTKNFIESVNGTDPILGNIITYENRDLAYRDGVELSATIDVGSLMGQDFTLRPGINMTHFFTAKTRNTPTSAWGPIRTVAMTNLSASLFFKHPASDFIANVSVNRYIKQYNATSFTSATVPTSYTLINLLLQKRLWQFADSSKVSARLVVKNLGDELYRTNYTASHFMPGRSIYGGLVYEY
jgi:outer membrane receptor protein involved in Fe transport